MTADNFVDSLGQLLKYKLNRFLDLNANYSFYGDLRSTFDSDTKQQFDLYRQRYIADLDTNIKLNAFDIKLTAIEFDIDFSELEQGELIFTFMLNISKLFEEYEEGYFLPFYTMLYVQLNYHCYSNNNDVVNKCRLKTDSDKRLLSKASATLISEAITRLNGELTFSILKT